MPIVNVTFVDGPDDDEQTQLIKEITKSIGECLKVPDESINVILNPVPARYWARAGTTLDQKYGL